ncbi:MAG TPA: galactose-1-phosphate uridylyltransferase [Candidatus Binatia bacterium]|nr:galactose-1-phosphate uridylyltransferase [Candidatus Binatia bacterium]
MSEFRQDPITGRWVIIAPERATRPRHIDIPPAPPPARSCPFCAGHEAMTPPEVWAERGAENKANAPGWRLRIVPNKYPAVVNDSAQSERNEGLYRSMSGAGVHEVIIESPEHVVHIAALSAGQLAAILRAYRARLRELKKDPRWRFLMVYKNQGERAGATFEHIHSQLIALPYVPFEARCEIDGARRHFEDTGRCIYCDVIRRESEHLERLVLESARFVALCPFAPRFGYETWILPKRHAPSFEESSDDDLAALAECVRAIIVKLNRILPAAPFNFVIHSAPNEIPAATQYHWHMEILPQVARPAGFEWGTGVHMNSVAPEEAARSLRDAPV